MSEALVSRLAELVAVDTTSTRTNAPLIEGIERRLSSLGFRCERQTYLDGAGVPKVNLLASVGEGLPELALIGHTDCVPFAASWAEALCLTERDGRLYGRGACDTKAFVACALETAERTRGRLHRPLLLAFTADEELGCIGAHKLVEANLGRCRRAIIGEPTRLHPVRANKGYCLAEIEVQGQEGHSAYPSTGVSAIFQAAKLLSRLEAYSLGPLRATEDPNFEPPYATLNVGFVSGGRAKNVIPGQCRFMLEWRPLPGQQVEEVLTAVHRECAALAAESPGFSASVSPLRLDCGFDTDEREDVVRFLAEKTGRSPLAVAFGTEAPQLRELGAQPVVFGPGDITVAHQTGEFVPREELVMAQNVLEAAVLHFCG
jgi:acetylornithine deacetylase